MLSAPVLDPRLLARARGGTFRVLTRDLIERRLRDANRHPERYLEVAGIPFLKPGFVELPGERSIAEIAGGAANTNPIFPLTPLIGFGTITAANTATDGTGTVGTLITAGGNGARLDRILLLPLGTNIATKAYIFVNNGGSQATATNNALIRDIPLAAATSSNTALIGSPVEYTVGLPLPSGYVINWCLATAVANGWKATAIGGQF